MFQLVRVSFQYAERIGELKYINIINMICKINKLSIYFVKMIDLKSMWGNQTYNKKTRFSHV